MSQPQQNGEGSGNGFGGHGHKNHKSKLSDTAKEIIAANKQSLVYQNKRRLFVCAFPRGDEECLYMSTLTNVLTHFSTDHMRHKPLLCTICKNRYVTVADAQGKECSKKKQKHQLVGHYSGNEVTDCHRASNCYVREATRQERKEKKEDGPLVTEQSQANGTPTYDEGEPEKDDEDFQAPKSPYVEDTNGGYLRQPSNTSQNGFDHSRTRNPPSQQPEDPRRKQFNSVQQPEDPRRKQFNSVQQPEDPRRKQFNSVQLLQDPRLMRSNSVQQPQTSSVQSDFSYPPPNHQRPASHGLNDIPFDRNNMPITQPDPEVNLQLWREEQLAYRVPTTSSYQQMPAVPPRFNGASDMATRGRSRLSRSEQHGNQMSSLHQMASPLLTASAHQSVQPPQPLQEQPAGPREEMTLRSEESSRARARSRSNVKYRSTTHSQPLQEEPAGQREEITLRPEEPSRARARSRSSVRYRSTTHSPIRVAESGEIIEAQNKKKQYGVENRPTVKAFYNQSRGSLLIDVPTREEAEKNRENTPVGPENKRRAELLLRKGVTTAGSTSSSASMQSGQRGYPGLASTGPSSSTRRSRSRSPHRPSGYEHRQFETRDNSNRGNRDHSNRPYRTNENFRAIPGNRHRDHRSSHQEKYRYPYQK